MPVRSTLTPLQHDLLIAFARRAPEFFTGGAALAHFHLGHRRTEDLDFFTNADVLPQGADALRQAAAALGATVSVISDAPEFKRYLVSHDTPVPGGLTVEQLRAYVRGLSERLAVMAFPGRGD